MAAGRRRPNLDSFLSGIYNAITAVQRTLSARERNAESIQRCARSVELCLTQVTRVQDMMPAAEHEALMTELRKYRADLHREDVNLNQSQRSSSSYAVPKLYDGRKGKPKYDITREQVEFLMALNFTVVKMARLLCVSESSMTRRMRADLHREDVNLNQSQRSSSSYAVPKLYDGRKGKPKYDITREQVEFLMALNFTVMKMARLLCVSESSMTRRMRDFGLSMQGRFSNITDEELDARIQAATVNNCNLGYRLVQAQLRSAGTVVQERRVREAMQRVDAAGVALRWGNTVQRRSYRVPVPNSLWHIDGNHKLIRWKIIVHGGVDGYSRLITYMNVADNNRASTVLSAFTAATHALGVPSRVRMDCGVENVAVEAFMLQQRGDGRGSVIKGRSVHNQRIERLWLDTFQSVLCVFHNIFSTMEELHILDVGYDAQLWALHYVFLPRVQRNLDTFIQQWNSHGLTSEHGNSPTSCSPVGFWRAMAASTPGCMLSWKMGVQSKKRAQMQREKTRTVIHAITYKDQLCQ